MSIFSSITGVFKKIYRFIFSEKVKKALELSASLVELALPVVRDLAVLSPKTAKVADLFLLYQKYGVPWVGYTESPASLGNALLNLATELLRKKLPPDKANASTNILNTAVQLAYTAFRADN